VAGEQEPDPRVYDVVVVLKGPGWTRERTAAESRLVIDRDAAVRRTATKWRLMLATPGRLLITDAQLAAELGEFLGPAT
jgi:hypothetical protein